jgi:hypothetical protein
MEEAFLMAIVNHNYNYEQNLTVLLFYAHTFIAKAHLLPSAIPSL